MHGTEMGCVSPSVHSNHQEHAAVVKMPNPNFPKASCSAAHEYFIRPHHKHCRHQRPLISCMDWLLQRGDTGDKNANAKQKWFEEKQKRKHAELERLGLDKTDMHRIETVEQVCTTTCLCL